MKTIATKFILAFLLISVFGFFSFAEGNDPILKEGATVKITGKIVDKNTGEPLTGVKVNYTASQAVVYTDFDGEFTIDVVVKKDAEIVVSMISYEMESIKLEKAESFNFKLIRQK